MPTQVIVSRVPGLCFICPIGLCASLPGASTLQIRISFHIKCAINLSCLHILNVCSGKHKRATFACRSTRQRHNRAIRPAAAAREMQMPVADACSALAEVSRSSGFIGSGRNAGCSIIYIHLLGGYVAPECSPFGGNGGECRSVDCVKV